MNVWITGESGFVARAFVRHLSHKHTIENSHLNDVYNYWRQKKFSPEHYPEIDIFDPTLKTIMERSEIDCILHTATMITHDKEKSHWMIRNNLEGSYYIAKIAYELNIPVIFIRYNKHNNAIFNWTQDSILSMFDTIGVKYIDIITDELFGPEDFHGSVSQLLMSSVGRIDTAKIFTNLESSKRYTFIDDFLDGLDMVLNNIDLYMYKSIEIMDQQEKSLEEIIDYMLDKMEIDLHYDIQEINDQPIYIEREKTKLLDWQCKYPFEAALEITRDLIHDRKRK